MSSSEAAAADASEVEPARARVAIISGLSGAGKTAASKLLEDVGYRVVDNLPAELLRNLAQLVAREPARYERLALVLELPDPGFERPRYLSVGKGVVDVGGVGLHINDSVSRSGGLGRGGRQCQHALAHLPPPIGMEVVRKPGRAQVGPGGAGTLGAQL